MSPAIRGQAHRRAATILLEAGDSVEAVAAHLLKAPPERDPLAVRSLRVAARDNLHSGDASGAVRILERALAEPPCAEEYADIVAELAQAQSRARMPAAGEMLETAINIHEVPERRASVSSRERRAASLAKAVSSGGPGL